MDEIAHNLFINLFAFRPREGLTPRENFLTEALVYVLRTNEAARKVWLQTILGEDIGAKDIEIETRAGHVETDTGATIYPDVQIDGLAADDTPFRVRIEHKWDGSCQLEQLTKYARLFDKEVTRGFLAFVCASPEQRQIAKCFPRDKFPGLSFRAFVWEDIYTCLDKIPTKSRTLEELLDFMTAHDLSPGKPITVEKMLAFLASSNFINQLLRYSNKLSLEHSWDFLPQRYRDNPCVSDRYGRVAVEFATKGWAPTITIGFLHDTGDHRVAFTKLDRGIDLLLRIEANPATNRDPVSVLDALRMRKDALEKLNTVVHLKNERGNGNRHTLLIVQKSLADVIDRVDTEQEQLEAIHAQFHQWCKVLFEDGKLEPALETIRE